MKTVVVLCIFVSCAQAEIIYLQNTTVDLTNLGMHLIGPDTMFERFSLTNLSLFPTHQYYNTKLPTVLFVYGYTDNFTSPVTDLIVKAYKARGGHNIAIIDWKDYDTGNYVSVISRMHWIASQFGENFHEIHSKRQIDLNTWHCVGFSLGAHLCGFTGRRIQQLSNNAVSLPKITALDAAGPGFYEPFIVYLVMRPLQKSDAKFIVAIHTDSKIAGTNWKIGHVDFWPNDGRSQPGCSLLTPNSISTDNLSCSHQRSYYIFAESVENINEKTFPAIKCRTILIWWRWCYETSDNVYMGYHTDTSVPEGNYYLKTNSEKPYNMGSEGMKNL